MKRPDVAFERTLRSRMEIADHRRRRLLRARHERRPRRHRAAEHTEKFASPHLSKPRHRNGETIALRQGRAWFSECVVETTADVRSGSNSQVLFDFEHVRFDTESGNPCANAKLRSPSHPLTISPSPHLARRRS